MRCGVFRRQRDDREWHPDGADILLKFPAYRTAKGTDVAAQSWRVVQNKDGEWRTRSLTSLQAPGDDP